MGKFANLRLGVRAAAVVVTIAAAGTASGFSLAAASSSNGNGNGNGGTSPGAPPAPVIGTSNLPSSPTNSTTTSFTYTDSRPSVGFLCSLDNSPFASCPTSGITYTNLSNRTHTFRVEAQSGNGPISSAASFSWVVANQTFPISGNLTTPFGPGAPAQTLNLLVTNPYTFTMKVTTINVTVVSTTKSGCASSNYKATSYSSATGFTVTAGDTKSMTAEGVLNSQLPTLQMLDLSTNQDQCKGATVNLSYSGIATTP